MRTPLLPVPALTVALAALIAGAGPSAALAQITPAPVPIPQGVPQAPIGHVQPRPAELPPDVRRDERSGPTAGQKAFDDKLENSICQKC